MNGGNGFPDRVYKIAVAVSTNSYRSLQNSRYLLISTFWEGSMPVTVYGEGMTG